VISNPAPFFTGLRPDGLGKRSYDTRQSKIDHLPAELGLGPLPQKKIEIPFRFATGLLAAEHA